MTSKCNADVGKRYRLVLIEFALKYFTNMFGPRCGGLGAIKIKPAIIDIKRMGDKVLAFGPKVARVNARLLRASSETTILNEAIIHGSVPDAPCIGLTV